MRFWVKMAYALLIVCLYLGVSSMDYEDVMAERDFYCDMVEEGSWPDYRGISEEECGAEG